MDTYKSRFAKNRGKLFLYFDLIFCYIAFKSMWEQAKISFKNWKRLPPVYSIIMSGIFVYSAWSLVNIANLQQGFLCYINSISDSVAMGLNFRPQNTKGANRIVRGRIFGRIINKGHKRRRTFLLFCFALKQLYSFGRNCNFPLIHSIFPYQFALRIFENKKK
jgi:hypothetical protein